MSRVNLTAFWDPNLWIFDTLSYGFLRSPIPPFTSYFSNHCNMTDKLFGIKLILNNMAMSPSVYEWLEKAELFCRLCEIKKTGTYSPVVHKRVGFLLCISSSERRKNQTLQKKRSPSELLFQHTSLCLTCSLWPIICVLLMHKLQNAVSMYLVLWKDCQSTDPTPFVGHKANWMLLVCRFDWE